MLDRPVVAFDIETIPDPTSGGDCSASTGPTPRLSGRWFDAAPDWSLPQGWCCMNCGIPFAVAETHAAHSPWHSVNEAQVMCNICWGMQHIGPTNLAAR